MDSRPPGPAASAQNTLPLRALESASTSARLRRTKDGVVVIHHDRRLNPDVARGPDGKWVTAPAPTVYELTFEQLQKYDVGRLRPGSEYAKRFPHQKPIDGTRIPKLADLFAMTRDSKVRFNIETKLLPTHPDETVGPEAFARALIAEFRKAGMTRRAVIQSSHARSKSSRRKRRNRTVYLTEITDAVPERCTRPGRRSGRPTPCDRLT
jgi:glycerophosphoryl diester phosphodiesterase